MDQDAPRSAGFYDFLGWIETNKKRVAMGAGLIAFAALIVGIWLWRSGERRNQAEEAFASVRMPYSPLETPPPGTAEAFAKVAAEYPDTPAAAKALLRAGTVYFGEGNYAKAREHFDLFLRSFGATPWVSEAVFGVAASLDAEGKATEAITKYRDFLNTYGSDPAADMARFNLARLYEQSNQPQLALETLNKMVNPQQPSPGMQEAQMKIRALLAKNPQLMPSNPPAPPIRSFSQPPIMVTPQGTPGTPGAPNINVNPAQPTPGQPNPQIRVTPTPGGPTPNIIVNPAQPAPGQPNAPIRVIPAPGTPTPGTPPPAAPAPGTPAPATPPAAK